ncbi:MAG: cytochrome-c oxidase, cbb3-type subunit III [Gammaproteobacteria bacterium]|nr:cytochrome-c oxidase, cbb3-type subunit III [Gammaproteobacteria bacterium]
MPDFTSGFWSWFIAVPTIGGFLGLFVLIRWMASVRGRREDLDTTGHVWDEDLEEYSNPLPGWWLNLFYITLVFGAVYLVLYPGLGAFKGVLGWSELKEYEQEMAGAEDKYGPIFAQYLDVDVKSLVDDPAAVRIGERLFAAYCTTCHGSDARGVRGFPNLRDQDWIWGGSPEAIEQTILAGRQGIMPPWGEALGKDGVFEVAEYVRQLSGRKADPVVAARGEIVFNQTCVACHGADGTGNQALGAPNLTDNVWLYGGSQARIIETVANGRQGRMPAHREFLGDAKVHLLATYVYSLSVGAEQ